MSKLLIVLALTSVGKIHGQGAVASQVLHLKPAPVDNRKDLYFTQDRFPTPTPTPRLYTNAFGPAFHENLGNNRRENINRTPLPARLRSQTPAPTPRLYTNAFRPTVHEDLRSNGGDIDVKPTVRGNQPKQKLFISITLPAEMQRPFDSGETTNSGRRQNIDDIRNRHVKEDKVLSTNDSANLIVQPENTNESKNMTTMRPKTNSDKIPPVVDLGERSSFDGDKCPPGTVRVNGECVQQD